MRIVCPSCAVTNRLPDQWAGRTFVCRKCRTLVTAPGAEGGRRVRPWWTSGGWLVAAALELVLAAAAVVATLLAQAKPPAGLPLVAGPADVPLQMAAPGKSVILEWPTEIESLGGYYRVVSHNIHLFDSQGHARVFDIRFADDPWPATFLDLADPPPGKAITLRVEVKLPANDDLAGTTVRLAGPAFVDYVEAGKEGQPQRARQKNVDREVALTVATPAQEAALERYVARRTVTHWAMFGSVMAFLFLGVTACAGAQKRVMVICPKCGRATESIYYFEAGEAYISPCPHTNRKR